MTAPCNGGRGEVCCGWQHLLLIIVLCLHVFSFNVYSCFVCSEATCSEDQRSTCLNAGTYGKSTKLYRDFSSFRPVNFFEKWIMSYKLLSAFFKWRLKVRMFSHSRISAGREFQVDGAALCFLIVLFCVIHECLVLRYYVTGSCKHSFCLG